LQELPDWLTPWVQKLQFSPLASQYLHGPVPPGMQAGKSVTTIMPGEVLVPAPEIGVLLDETWHVA